MKKLQTVFLLYFLLLGFHTEINAHTYQYEMGKINAHPRLLMTKADEAEIKTAISKDRYWAETDSLLRKGAKDIISQPVAKRIVIGRRLLDVSRETLRRVLLLGYTYRMTNDKLYSERAEQELKAVCTFSDWNPSHFLDVAEMTTAIAIGYDWFYDVFSERTKQLLRAAIIEKGIEPSFNAQYNDWLERTNNWNQVCNSGIAYGALAIYEDEPDLARKVIDRSVESIRIPMKNYAPIGAYPEGYSYWGFGTTYNVMLIDALQKSLNTDFGLSEQEGFLQTAAFVLHMIAPDGESFNYGDNKGTGRLSPAMFWLARKNNDDSLLWNERLLFKKGSKKALINYRFFTLSLLWGAGFSLNNLHEPQSKAWFASSTITPVALMRTTWSQENGIFLAFKGGSATTSHAHLDAGSFVMVADGERWAMDFGRQDYHSLESKGMDIWNKSQTSDRWKVFRYNNLAHNTLTFDNQLQDVEGYADIDETGYHPNFSYAISNLTPVYQGQIKKVRRGVALVDEKYVVVRDEILTSHKPTTVRWTMLTPAHVEILDKRTVRLTQNNKQLYLYVDAPTSVQVTTWSTFPTTLYDMENPGTVRIGFETILPANKEVTLQVSLIPLGNSQKSTKKIGKLDTWKIKNSKK